MVIFHKHHIIPKHIGGSDCPQNIIKVNIPLHAFLHKLLYEEHGRWQDELAWKCLSGHIEAAEAIKEAQRNYMKNRIVSEETRKKMGDSNRRRSQRGEHPMQGKKFSLESREKMRISHLGKSPSNKGVQHSKESNMKNSESNKNRRKTVCDSCGKIISGDGNLKQHKSGKVCKKLIEKKKSSACQMEF